MLHNYIKICWFACILVTPDVEVVLSHGRTRINIGAIIVINCNVGRTNPQVTTYSWIHEHKGALLGNASTLTLTLSTIQDFGTYRCEVSNAANLTGSGNVTIEQGCK